MAVTHDPSSKAEDLYVLRFIQFAPIVVALASIPFSAWIIGIVQPLTDAGIEDVAVNDWIKLIFSSGGPLAVGYLWYRRYIETINGRSAFLEDEVTDLRDLVKQYRTERDAEAESHQKTRTLLSETIDELHATKRELSDAIHRVTQLTDQIESILEQAAKEEDQ